MKPIVPALSRVFDAALAGRSIKRPYLGGRMSPLADVRLWCEIELDLSCNDAGGGASSVLPL